MMRARRRAKRNGDKREEDLVNEVLPNASSTTKVRKIRPEESWWGSVRGWAIGTWERGILPQWVGSLRICAFNRLPGL